MKPHKTTLFAVATAALLTPAGATLIGYWPMDETAGDIAESSVSAADAEWQNTGTVLWAPAGMVGGAADLPGGAAGDHFSIDLNGELANAEGLTIVMWVNPDGFTGGVNYEGLFMTRPANGPGLDGTSAGNGNWGLAWQFFSDAENPSVGHLDSRVSNARRSAPDTLLANVWTHIALVWDGVNNTHVQYINGVLSDASGETNTPGAGTISGGVWHIGNDSCCGGRQFDGQVDDVAIWDTALTDAQIMSIFDKTVSPGDIDPPTDSDGDGMPDDYEEMFEDFLDPFTADADADVDRIDSDPGEALTPDGLTNAEERVLGTDPSNPDTDGDGLLDGAEVNTHGTDPLVADTDGDGVDDGEELAGFNGFDPTDPLVADSDNDTLSDGQERDRDPVSDPNDPNDPFALPPLPTQGLIALYRLDETDPATGAADSATADGAQDAVQDSGTVAWTTGIIGGALDNTTGTDLLIDDSLLTGATEFTLTAWVNLDATGGYRGVFMSRGAGNAGNWGFATNDHQGGYAFDYRFDNSGGGSEGKDTNPGTATIGTWHHLAQVWRQDGTGETYLNGVPGPTKTGASTVFEEVSEMPIQWVIGSDINRRFDGQIDEISVWDVALSQQDIVSIYRNGLEGNGLLVPEGIDFQITNIIANPDGSFDLTWNSDPLNVGTIEEATYSVFYNTNLEDAILDWADADDGVASQGESTTFTVEAGSLPDPLPEDLFFKIRLNEAVQN